MSDTQDWSHIDAVLTERAEAFERDRAARAVALERRRMRRIRRTNAQFWFLFVLVFASFILLAYRTEVAAGELRTGLYTACQSRVEQAQQYNQGREALINAVLTNPERPVPEERKAEVVRQLEEGLLLPLEDCGPDPNA